MYNFSTKCKSIYRFCAVDTFKTFICKRSVSAQSFWIYCIYIYIYIYIGTMSCVCITEDAGEVSVPSLCYVLAESSALLPVTWLYVDKIHIHAGFFIVSHSFKFSCIYLMLHYPRWWTIITVNVDTDIMRTFVPPKFIFYGGILTVFVPI
jgi:hypothetical protein